MIDDNSLDAIEMIALFRRRLRARIGVKFMDGFHSCLEFGPAKGVAGAHASYTALSDYYFYCEGLVLADNASPAGSGVRIVNMYTQFTGSLPPHTKITPGIPSTAGTTCIVQAAQTAAIDVEFLKDCTFKVTLYGVSWGSPLRL